MYQSKLDMMNTEQYGRTLWQANVNSGKNPNANSIGYQYDWGYNAKAILCWITSMFPNLLMMPIQ